MIEAFLLLLSLSTFEELSLIKKMICRLSIFCFIKLSIQLLNDLIKMHFFRQWFSLSHFRQFLFKSKRTMTILYVFFKEIVYLIFKFVMYCSLRRALKFNLLIDDLFLVKKTLILTLLFLMWWCLLSMIWNFRK